VPWDRIKGIEKEIVTKKGPFWSGMQWIAERERVRGSKDRNSIKWTMEIKHNLGYTARVKYTNTKILNDLFRDLLLSTLFLNAPNYKILCTVFPGL